MRDREVTRSIEKVTQSIEKVTRNCGYNTRRMPYETLCSIYSMSVNVSMSVSVSTSVSVEIIITNNSDWVFPAFPASNSNNSDIDQFAISQ